tara:strand:+ start:2854 stop:3906 length:1053 start_codon:yes stop_codon:yes gene_type:complete
MDATQQDAEVVEEVVEAVEEAVEETTEDQEEYVDRTVQGPREEMLERIVKQRESDVEEDFFESTEENTEEKIEEVLEEIEEDLKNDAPVWQHEGQWVTQVRVNGQDVVVPFDSLKSSHQKDVASQQRFQQAAYKEKLLAQQEAQLRQYAQSLQQKESAPPVKDEPEDDVDYNKTVEEYHQALYEDDAAKAANLLQTLTGRNTATLNIDEAVDKAVSDAFSRRQAQQAKAQQLAYQQEVQNAVSWFDQEYPEVSQNPDLRAIADNQTVTLMKENPSWTPGQIIYASAEYARHWANSFVPNQPATNERVERKKKIVQQPKSARKTLKVSEDDSGPKTPEQIIEEMKQSRGQL